MPRMQARTSPRLLLDERAIMRDGVSLSAYVCLPTTGDGPWPVILQRTPFTPARPGRTEVTA
jgi:predicted acyl esterase